MESLIRACYKEAGLVGANALVLESRKNTINKILDSDYIDEGVSMVIASWLMGNEKEEIEEVLVDIEKFFCEEDSSFSAKDEKEMRVLCSIILLEYCKKTEDKKISLIILCGKGVQKKLICTSLYNQFQRIIDNARVEFRKCTNEKGQYKNSGIKALKKGITDERNELQEEEYEYSTQQLDKLITVIEAQDNNIRILQKDNEILQKKISCQREESDVLWWMMNKWSYTYRKSFTDMTEQEMAIAIPLELHKYSMFSLLPYSAERIIYSLIVDATNNSTKLPLASYMKNIDEAVIELLDINTGDIESVQPILAIISCMKECGMEETAWKSMLKKKYGNNADEISLTPIEFAKHFCLELELVNYL